MKTGELLTMQVELENMVGTKMPLPGKFAYAVARNLKLLAPVKEAFMEQIDPSKNPIMQAYDADRVASLTEIAEKNPDGSPVVVENQFVISDPAEQTRVLAEVLARHPDLPAEQTRLNNLIRELQEAEEPNISFYMIDDTLIPAQITAGTMFAILPMIRETS